MHGQQVPASNGAEDDGDIDNGGHRGWPDGSVEKHNISEIRSEHKTSGYQLRESEATGVKTMFAECL